MTQKYKGKRLPNYMDIDEMDGCTQAMFEAAIPKFSSIPKIGKPVIFSGTGISTVIPDRPTLGDGFIPAERYLYNSKLDENALKKLAKSFDRINRFKKKKINKAKQVRHNWKYGLYLKLQKMHKEGAFKKK
jgi:hypothetical protein